MAGPSLKNGLPMAGALLHGRHAEVYLGRFVPPSPSHACSVFCLDLVHLFCYLPNSMIGVYCTTAFRPQTSPTHQLDRTKIN